MNVFFLTMGIFLVCTGLMAVGVLLQKKPLEKRCSADPDEVCTCRADGEGECKGS